MNFSKIKKASIISLSSLAGLFFLSFFLTLGIRSHNFAELSEAKALNDDELYSLNEILLSQYEKEPFALKSLPYTIPEPKLELLAQSAILIDTENGNILYEKNADQVIPPASMTKLFAMFVVDEEVAAGNLAYNQLVPLPPESWACNMPPHSSLMFLGEGQRVTLEELLLGLSICSGNDAAYALAYLTCGSMEAFVERMNLVASDLGLTHTHFVESSGYSELNTTTAREMVLFARQYILRHPDSLKRFHSVASFTYPKEKNLAPGDSLENQDFSKGLPRHITMPVTQMNTNPLLGKLEGCDGLKTGYIDESGYNLSLTAKRGNTRFLSVTMKGPGANAAEGQNGRIYDGTALMEWAFYSFADYSISDFIHPYFVKNYASKADSINLIPAFSDKVITVPFISGQSMTENLSKLQVQVDLPEAVFGPVEQGSVLGSIKITLDGWLLQEIPLLSDRNTSKTNFFFTLADKFLYSKVYLQK